MLSKLLYNLTATRPTRLIKVNDRPYLERYYLGSFFGYTAYLHRFVSADTERHVHNHPWRRTLSVVLTGNYVETVATDLSYSAQGGAITERIRRRWLNFVPHNRFHQIGEAAPETWTLFVHGPRMRIETAEGRTAEKGWGFIERRYLVGDHEAVMFVPMQSARRDWHTFAQAAHAIGREPHG